MVAIVTRAGKGSPLTNDELDANFVNLNNGLGTGSVQGPAVSLDNALARWDTTTGQLLQNSAATLLDNGVMTLGGTYPGLSMYARDASGKFFGMWSPSDGVFQMGHQGSANVFIKTGGQTTINATGGTSYPPPSDAGVMLQVVGPDATSAKIELDAFGGNPLFVGRGANGPPAAPTAMAPGGLLAAFQGRGYGATGYSTGRASMHSVAAEAWTDAAQGAALEFITTPLGSNISATRWQISPGGTFLPLTDNAFDIGTTGFRVRNFYGSAGIFSGNITASSGSFGPEAMPTLGGQTGVNRVLYWNTAGSMSAQVYDVPTGKLDTILKGIGVNTVAADGLHTMRGTGAALLIQSSSPATTAVNAFVYMPSDYGVGKPQLYIAKTTNATMYQIGLWDTVNSTGMIDFASSALRSQGAFECLSTIKANNGFHTAASVALTIYKTADGSATGVRWHVGQDNVAESGGNVGSNFCINRFNDTGVFLDRPFVIDRDTALAKFAGDMTFNVGGVSSRPEPRGRYWAFSFHPVAAYTLIASDQGALVQMEFATACTLTIPTNAAVPFPSGTRIDIVQWGAGQVSIAPAGGVGLRSAGGKRKLTGMNSSASLVKAGVDEWLLVGDLVA